jgi:hypothetical protein
MNELVAKWPREKALRLREVLDRLHLCDCGNSTQWECVLELLVEAENHSKDGFYRDRWFEFGAKVLDSWDLLDHGSSIGFAFLTADGTLLLEFLRDFGTVAGDLGDENGYPLWAEEFSWSIGEDANDSYGRWARRVEAAAAGESTAGKIGE